jgi:predicted HTH transcriptional regulator
MQSEVVCVLFRETVGVSRSADRKIVTGTIQDLINGAEAFLNRYIAIGARVEGFKRIDLLEYSLEVLPEAAINAVVHRNYSKRGESIRVFYYPDRVEVHSPGMLLPGITVEQMEQGIVRSRLRNSVLAGLLRDVPGYMERVGSGIRYMLAETKRLRLPSPQFKEMDEFIVTFARASGLAVSRSQQQPRYNRTLWNEPLQLESSVQEVSDKLEHRLTQVVVYVQGYGFITNALYRELTGVSERTAVRDLETHRSLQFQAVFENYPLKRLILSM